MLSTLISAITTAVKINTHKYKKILLFFNNYGIISKVKGSSRRKNIFSLQIASIRVYPRFCIKRQDFYRFLWR